MLFNTGDLVHMRGSLVSFFDRVTMTAVEFLRGGRVGIDGSDQPRIDHIDGQTLKLASRPRGRLVVAGTKSKRANQTMRPDEEAHFSTHRMSLDEFCEIMAPLIKTYAAEGTRKPAQVSARLNKERRGTTANDKWTPRLAWLLLAEIFSRHSGKQGGKADSRGARSR